jgi:hypothetical protein
VRDGGVVRDERPVISVAPRDRRDQSNARSKEGKMATADEEERGRGKAIVGVALVVVALTGTLAWLRRRHRDVDV